MGANAPECIETARLVLRRPQRRDAEIIFSRYANDPEVTRYLAWPRHRSLRDTLQFLEFSDNEWEHSPGGPYLIEARDSGQVLGSTGTISTRVWKVRSRSSMTSASGMRSDATFKTSASISSGRIR